MQFDWDPAKYESNLSKHGVDFVDAARLLHGNALVALSPNSGNDTQRYLAIGEVDGRIFAVIYTLRGNVHRIISMRKARHGEAKKYRAFLGQ
jgi:uncharacterized protein